MSPPRTKRRNLGLNELQQAGFTEQPDGSWSKTGAVSGNTSSRTKRKPDDDGHHTGEDANKKAILPRAIAIVTVYTVGSRDQDGLGTAAKYYIDGLRHLKLIEEDTREVLETSIYSEKADNKESERTEILIYEVPDE